MAAAAARRCQSPLAAAGADGTARPAAAVPGAAAVAAIAPGDFAALVPLKPLYGFPFIPQHGEGQVPAS